MKVFVKELTDLHPVPERQIRNDITSDDADRLLQADLDDDSVTDDIMSHSETTPLFGTPGKTDIARYGGFRSPTEIYIEASRDQNKKLIARNRWRLGYTLYWNPQLRRLRRRGCGIA